MALNYWFEKANEIPEDWHVSARWTFNVIIDFLRLTNSNPETYKAAWEQIENRSVAISQKR